MRSCLCFIQFGSSFYCSNFNEIPDTAPLSSLFLLSSVYFLHRPPLLKDSNVLGLRAQETTMIFMLWHVSLTSGVSAPLGTSMSWFYARNYKTGAYHFSVRMESRWLFFFFVPGKFNSTLLQCDFIDYVFWRWGWHEKSRIWQNTRLQTWNSHRYVMHLTVNSPRGQLALNKLAVRKGNSLAENDAGQRCSKAD